MDLHKVTMAAAVAPSGGGEVRYVVKISNTPNAIEKSLSARINATPKGPQPLLKMTAPCSPTAPPSQLG